MFNSLRNYQTIYHSSSTIFQQCTRVPVSTSVLAGLLSSQQEHGDWLLPGKPRHDMVAGKCTLTPPSPPSSGATFDL